MKRRIFLITVLLLALFCSAHAEGVSYLDASGAVKTHTGSIKTVTSITTTMNTGWYVVSYDTTVSGRMAVTGDVHLILADGKTLTAEEGIKVEGSGSLTVYAQSKAKSTVGKLIANANKVNYGAGIGSAFNSAKSCGTIVINGGWIEATGGSGYYASAGIGGKNAKVTINGGYVIARGDTSSYGAGAGIGGGGQSQSAESITITGGVIKATGGPNGAAGIGGGGHDGQLRNSSFTGGWIVAEGNYRSTGQSGQGYANAIGGGANVPPTSLTFSNLVLIDGKTKQGRVYGNAVLSGDAALESGVTLNVPSDATLFIPAEVNFTVGQGAQIVNNGIIYTDVSLSCGGDMYHITHNMAYEAEGNKLRVYCDNPVNMCSLGTDELTLFAPLKASTEDNESPEALLIGENWPEEAEAPVLGYEMLADGQYVPLNAAPTAAGRYRAYAAAGNAKATVEYEIKAPAAPETTPLPETGDESRLLLLCAAMILSMAGLHLTMKKARR